MIIFGGLAILLVGGISGYALKSGTMQGRHNENYTSGIKGNYGDDVRPKKTNHELNPIGMGDHSQHMMPGMSVTSERQFIEQMIPHHEEAVATAKEVLARGATTPGIQSLAETIITAQEKEIADMKRWYYTWYGEVYADKNTYSPMMRELTKLSGAELDAVFLEDMIQHHMGAIMMAQSVASHIEHIEITNLSQAIISSQSEEIILMRSLRADIE